MEKSGISKISVASFYSMGAHGLIWCFQTLRTFFVLVFGMIELRFPAICDPIATDLDLVDIIQPRKRCMFFWFSSQKATWSDPGAEHATRF